MYFNIKTQDCKIVADYIRDSFKTVSNLDVFEYWGYLHDAVVWNCSKSEAGRQYLEDAYYQMQTEPDRAALRKL